MIRKLRDDEVIFLRFLLSKAEGSFDTSWLNGLLVEDMKDGGMGSLLFLSPNTDRTLGKQLISWSFKDEDGIEVVATLSNDNHGDLYELDMWKVDFSQIRRLTP